MNRSKVLNTRGRNLAEFWRRILPHEEAHQRIASLEHMVGVFGGVVSKYTRKEPLRDVVAPCWDHGEYNAKRKIFNENGLQKQILLKYAAIITVHSERFIDTYTKFVHSIDPSVFVIPTKHTFYAEGHPALILAVEI